LSKSNAWEKPVCLIVLAKFVKNKCSRVMF